MSDYRTGPGCTGLTMEDGTRYDAGRDGRIVVDNPAHRRAIERAAREGGGHIHQVVMTSPRGIGSRVCACAFVGYLWQHTCPRCGREMEKDVT